LPATVTEVPMTPIVGVTLEIEGPGCTVKLTLFVATP
jgi:hypothetical protein